MFVIGKYGNPRCFKNKNLPVPYFFNKKAWMTSEIWQQILIIFDRKMKTKKRKAVLFCDNASCHKQPELNLLNVSIRYIPPNVTSIIQTLDQGIIRALKAHYRTNLIRQLVLAIDNGENLESYANSVTVLKAIPLIK